MSFTTRREQLLELKEKTGKVIRHKDTVQKKLTDFPVVDQYIKLKFPGVDISDVSLYMTSPRVMADHGWYGIGGCYIDAFKMMFVKNDFVTIPKVRGKFRTLMQASSAMKIEVEDVLVHEGIHAISSKMGRSLAKYTHMEEEFVYTNCIDFYKQKGMDNEQIISNNFLPFCIYDVYKSPTDLKKVFAGSGFSLSTILQMKKPTYLKFLNNNAENLVPAIIKRAQEKARRMIDIYVKYGASTYRSENIQGMDDVDRFSVMGLD
jgi:hypothetical protein